MFIIYLYNANFKVFATKNIFQNKVLTQNVAIGLDGRKHRRNLNTLVCGGSGAGKTRFYCKINLMQCNTSFVILDPKGEMLRDTGGLLEKNGYELRGEFDYQKFNEEILHTLEKIFE